jgi:hypothetical protein
MDIMTRLEGLRDALALVPDVNTCRIGLEADIAPDDYPIVRVVPTQAKPSGFIGRQKVEVLIYFGLPIQAFDDEQDAAGRVRLEKLYAKLFGMEAEVLAVVTAQNGIYLETMTDEDRLDTFKIMAIRATIDT